MAMVAPVAVAVVQQRVLDPTDTADPARAGIVYSSKLHPNAKFVFCMPIAAALGGVSCLAAMTCAPLCNLICWDKLNKRSYVRVYENALVTNHATTCCFGLTECDIPHYTHLDELPDSVMAPGSCTPGHCCWCFECAGGVVAMSPNSCLNTCFCPCCRCYIPGVDQPMKLVDVIVQTRSAVQQGARLAPGSFMLQAAPVQVQMV